MKTTVITLIALLFIFSTGSIFAQNGWGRGSNYNKLYDTKTVETISGTVTKIDKIYPDKNSSYGVHLTISTSNGDINVHLGPAWYIENQDIQIVKDDNVTVTGSRVTYDGSSVIIAKEVTKGDQVLKLRDDDGYPLWSGWKNKNR